MGGITGDCLPDLKIEKKILFLSKYTFGDHLKTTLTNFGSLHHV
jgi:hypothetical protein